MKSYLDSNTVLVCCCPLPGYDCRTKWCVTVLSNMMHNSSALVLLLPVL
uniref:Uncharacterized protein n=1 Tax=Arundo donax TaxID=35708 RepID=A0A0A9C9J9_ARUDO